MRMSEKQSKWVAFKGWLFGSRSRLKDGQRQRNWNETGTASGERVNSDTAMSVDAVFACAGLISQSIGHLPINIHSGSDKSVMKDHPLSEILSKFPNSVSIAPDFWEAVVMRILFDGNAYVEARRFKGNITSLIILDDVEVVRNDNKLDYFVGGEKLDKDNIIHIKYLTLDGFIGVSVLQYAAETVGDALGANRTASNEFRIGGKEGGYVKVPGSLNTEQRERLRSEFDKFSQEKNRGRHILLEMGMEYQARGAISPVDLELLESRRFSVEQICRFFRVPPTMIGHSDASSSWASSQDALNGWLLRYTLSPIMTKIEKSLAKVLLKGEKNYIKFNPEALLRADSQSRAKYYESMKRNGIMTTNEIRALEDLPPIDGGDEILVQVQYVPLDQAGKEGGGRGE